MGPPGPIIMPPGPRPIMPAGQHNPASAISAASTTCPQVMDASHIQHRDCCKRHMRTNHQHKRHDQQGPAVKQGSDITPPMSLMQEPHLQAASCQGACHKDQGRACQAYQACLACHQGPCLRRGHVQPRGGARLRHCQHLLEHSNTLDYVMVKGSSRLSTVMHNT
jgi:hypothetical protein